MDAVGHPPVGQRRPAAHPLDHGRAPRPVDARGPHDHEVRKQLRRKFFRREQHVGGGPLRIGRGGLGDAFAVTPAQHARGGHQDHERLLLPERTPQPPQAAQVGVLVPGDVVAVRREGDHHGVHVRKARLAGVREIQGHPCQRRGQPVRMPPHTGGRPPPIAQSQPQRGSHVPAAGQQNTP